MDELFSGRIETPKSGESPRKAEDGKDVEKIVPENKEILSITDSLAGILHQQYDLDDIRVKELKMKYGVCRHEKQGNAKKRV